MCREYPPAAYPPGGIGTYVRHITALLAQAGETVHVIAHRWDGAPRAHEALLGGRLIVHRVALDDRVPDPAALPGRPHDAQVPAALLASTYPAQAFSWQAALLAEQLIEREGIDVIEAQEWEAPLYYFQLRRSLGLGAARRPACVVHLHSPSERIFAANAWDTTVTDYAPSAALEAYSITAADAILSPSRFVADEAIARYGIPAGKVSIIPYPRGEAAPLDRDDATWAAGSICHVGRLEPRKGVLEWAEAIASVAADHPDVRFDFVGGDTPLEVTGGPTVGQAMLARVPRHVRRQLRFHGTRDRAGIAAVLSTACASVVPSRWENFPYSCIEAMSSGLPVIVSPTGGMRELVADGVSGWVAPDGTPAGLATALQRALAASGQERRRMGAAAADTVGRVCDSATIVERHLAMKAGLTRDGRSSGLTAAPVDEAVPAPSVAGASGSSGIAVVVLCGAGGTGVESCLASVRAQVERPAQVCLVCDDADMQVGGVPAAGWRVEARGERTLEAAALDVARTITAGDRSIGAVAFVDARVRLEPEATAIGRARFAAEERLGVLSAWIREGDPPGRIVVPPAPDVPYVWPSGELSPYVMVRSSALESAPASAAEPGLRPVCDAVTRAGAIAASYPVVLGSFASGGGAAPAWPAGTRFSSMAQAVQRLHTPLLQWLLSCSPGDRRTFVVDGMRHPGRSAQWLASRALRAVRNRAGTRDSTSPPPLRCDEDQPHGARRSR